MTEQEKIDFAKKEVLDFFKEAFCIDGKAKLVKEGNLKIKSAVELNDSKRGKFYIGVLVKEKSDKQEPGAVVELNEEVIKQVIKDWQKPYKWIAFPEDVCQRAIERSRGSKEVLVMADAIRIGLLATLPTALVNTKGILKWREEK